MQNLNYDKKTEFITNLLNDELFKLSRLDDYIESNSINNDLENERNDLLYSIRKLKEILN